MTHTEIATMLNSIGYPTAYYQFPDDSGQQPPFICFYYPGRDDFVADNGQYSKVESLTVELYTDEKDFEAEAAVESALESAGIVYGKMESYIDSEKMQMVTYTSEFVLAEEESNG